MATDAKAHYRDMLAEVRRRRDGLPRASRIVASLPDDLFEELQHWVEATPAQNLDYAGWPPLVAVLDHVTEDAIQELHADLELLLRHTSPQREAAVTQFLRASAGQSRLWYGGLFDVWARTTALKQQSAVAFDLLAPQRR